ncbi:MAG: glycogen/starch/alpha-glucan phosphorylase, partial [Acidobacteriia bacterium]|nr:glycogen/starch/alpha-glucan phosphorylase [Terriglobia bacterium]
MTESEDLALRRWLKLCNPRLAALIGESIGNGWVTDL